MNRYMDLMDRAEKCEAVAMKSETEWSKNFWKNVANKLKEKAKNLKIDEIRKGGN